MPDATPRGEAPPVAAALRDDADRESAPQIVATAEEAGVPVTEDPAPATALVTLDLDAVVPPALFDALAAIIAWAYRQEGATAH